MQGQPWLYVQTRGWNAGDQLCWKKFGDLVNSKLNMCQQCAHTAREANCKLGSINHSTASQSREGIVLLCTALVHPHLEYCVQLGNVVQKG